MASIPKAGPAIKTPEGRLSFPHLREPETQGKFPSNKYVTTFLIPKTADIKPLIAACMETAKQMWPTLNITQPSQIALPIKDGDEREQTKGHWVIKCKTKSKPMIVDRTKATYTGTIKGGDYAYLSVVPWPFVMATPSDVCEALKQAGKVILSGKDRDGKDMRGRPAVTLLLNGVQWLREGPALGGHSGGADVFDAEASDSSDTGSLFDALG